MQKKQNTVQSLRHKTIRNIIVINFKKITSMIVMLSLILGACGKSPARRDEDAAMQTNGENVIGANSNSEDSEKDKPTFDKWRSDFNWFSAQNKAEYKGLSTYETVKKWWGGHWRGLGAGAIEMVVASVVVASAIQ